MTKTVKKGFTIIELLIVIVVIGILAAIVVVTYQGVQNQANTTAAEQNAREVVNKATAFNAVATVYPTWDELKIATPSGASDKIQAAELSEKVKNLIGNNDNAPAGTDSTSKNRIQYTQCKVGSNPVGAVATFWDFSKNQVRSLRVGETKGTGNNCDSIQ